MSFTVARCSVSDHILKVAQHFTQDLTHNTALASSFVICKDSYTDKNTGVTHVYIRQYLHSIEVADGNINVNVKDGVVLSYGDLDVDTLNDLTWMLFWFMIATIPNVSLAQDIIEDPASFLAKILSIWEMQFVGDQGSITMLIDNVPYALSPVPQGESTALELIWKFEVEMQDNWCKTAVSAASLHHIVSVVNWASDLPVPTPKLPSSLEHAIYKVLAWGINDPSVGNRSIQKENYDVLTSSIGWHSLPFANNPQSMSHKGSDVFAHENLKGRNVWKLNYHPNADADMVFKYKYVPTEIDCTDALGEAKKYINATVMQLFYYGLDKVLGNFQQHNFGRGSAENGAAFVNAQDSSRYNNANFMMPPDCQKVNPYHDGDMEAGIIIYELSYLGRLGWGESTSTYSDYAMGVWANKTIKPSIFVDSLFLPSPCKDGTVPDSDFYHPVKLTLDDDRKLLIPKHGNSLIQCRPPFFDACDTIIQVDSILTGSENHCDLWAAFAECGLSLNVTGRGLHTNNFKVPRKYNTTSSEVFLGARLPVSGE
ncbi:uncharacterized protein LAESUDRAFT_737688 [Laetiporus sulphureus 93-53]|uniref:Extracellular metalloproteinase n=1 Tax=Laetiporus sulphureus 93-53 TaxID=1314785 RepID=A0A165DM20_9APHY|nr:uncharacterized protein LAESUDRAFT_737688 [Laetiporus sulphureus 93-53]KZT05175.1 hypothetical protein LAESUDRAFT_737688 [Laetiporus sulphureus 93-53]